MATCVAKPILARCPVRTLLAGMIALTVPQGAAACGYHDDVSLARGVLNWVYPDALHVVGAMAQAVSKRQLPAPTAARDPWAYHRIVRSLHQYAAQLRMLAGEKRPPAFSLLLIEPMLWSRFAAGGGDLQAQVHVSAPPIEELVLITGEDVLREITNDRLSVGEAYRQGLIRLYGTEDQVASFLNLYE